MRKRSRSWGRSSIMLYSRGRSRYILVRTTSGDERSRDFIASEGV